MLEGLTPPVKEMLCAVMSRAAEKLDTKDMTILNEALADSRWSNNALAEELTKRNFPIGEGAIRKHRTGKCCCAR